MSRILTFILLLVSFSALSQPGGRRPIRALEAAPDSLMIPLTKLSSLGNYDQEYHYLYDYTIPLADTARFLGEWEEYHRDTVFLPTPAGAAPLLAVNKFVPIYFNASGNPILARADNSGTLHQLYIIDTLSRASDGFIVQQSGYLDAPGHPFTTGQYMYLDSATAGNVSHTRYDIDDVMGWVESANRIWLVDNRPGTNVDTGGGGTLTGAQNGVGLNGTLVELGFPLIRATLIDGDNNSLTIFDLGGYSLGSNSTISTTSAGNTIINAVGGTSDVSLLAGDDVIINAPKTIIVQTPPTENSLNFIVVRDPVTGQLKLRDASSLQTIVEANQALSKVSSATADTIQLGTNARPGQEYSSGRFVTPLDTNSYVEFYDDSPIGRNRWPLRFATESYPENGHYGIQWESIGTGVKAGIGMSNSVLRLVGDQGVQLAYGFESRLATDVNDIHFYRPLTIDELDLSAIAVLNNRGTVAVSDGTVTSTIDNQLYYYTQNEGEVPLSVKVHSAKVDNFGVPLAVGETDWTWTVPSYFDGYRLIAVEHTFAVVGTNAVTISITLNGALVASYNATLAAGGKSIRTASPTPITLLTGNTIRGRLLTAPTGTPAEAWTITLEFAKL